MNKVSNAVVGFLGLVLVLAALVVLYPLGVAVLTGWVWVGVFGSLLTFVKVVAAVAAGTVGVLAVRHSRD